MSFKIIIAVFVVLTFSTVSSGLNFTFTLSARDLPSMDPLDGDPDTYVSVYYSYGSGGIFDKVRDSQVVDDTRNPDWDEPWSFSFTPGVSERLRFELWDSDFDGDDLIGIVGEIYFAELYNDEDGVVIKDLTGGVGGGGRLIFNITTDESKNHKKYMTIK